jgi:hypothetical protein
MAIRVTRRFRPFIAPALVSMALTACSSATPTAPSSQSASDAAPHAVTASVSSASVATGAAQLSAANTIKINQGTLALPSGGGLAGPLTLKGSHGFRFDGRAYTAGLTPSNYCGFGSPCQPGATVAFTATWVGGDIPGTVRLQGDEFEVGNLDQPGNISPVLTGSFVAPAHVGDTASVTVPFEVGGLLTPAEQRPGFQLTGGGDVTFTLQWQPFIGGWAITFSFFDFGGGRPR